jgi:5'-nucleotidase
MKEYLMKKGLILSTAVALALSTTLFTGCVSSSNETVADVNISGLTKVGSYETSTEGASEIVVFDATSKKAFVTNGDANAIDILDLSSPTSPSKLSSIDLSSYGTGVNSVAVKNGLVAVAVQNGNSTVGKKQLKGNIVFFDTEGTHKKTVEAGYLPDMVTFNEDGTKVIVANEGEPNDTYTVDPIGSVGIITVSDYSYVDVDFASATLTKANDGTAVRLGGTPSNDQAKDLEPEYVTVSGNHAYVTLQENNAMAKVNLTNNTLEYVKSYGAKSWEADSNNTIDIEEEGTIKMKSYAGLFGLYQPDSIASYTANGATYLVTANEGDGREYLYDDNGTEKESHNDEKKISKLTLDDSIQGEYADDNDLKVMIDLGDIDKDGAYEKLYTYGARSFSIWDANGDLVWDSGDAISKKVAELQPALFNQDEGEMDGRSGNKGAEPEALTVGTIGNKTFAFIGLERQNAIMTYDITDPKAPKYIDYLITEPNDVSPEGMQFIPASKSPDGKNYLMVSFEVSGSTTVYEVK